MLELDKIVATYRLATQYPAAVSARIVNCPNDSSITVQSIWVQRNLERQTMTRFRQMTVSDYETFTTKLPPTDIADELMSAYSESDELFCVVREVDTGNGKENKLQYLEIWDSCNLKKNYDLKALDVHGKIYADPIFATLQWSSDESKIVYVAEKNVRKSEPFYKQKPSMADDKLDLSSNSAGKEHEWSQDWGEQLVGKIAPVLVVCDVKTDTIAVLPNIPDDVHPAAATWIPDGSGVVAVGYLSTPRKLGLVYCTDRPSCIFSITLNGQYNVLNSNSSQLCAMSPVFNSNGSKLLWLESQNSCLRLISYNWASKKISTVVDFVYETSLVSNGRVPFYGLYNDSLLSRCWLNDDKTILLSTPQGGSVHTFAIDTESKGIHYLPVTKPFQESVYVLDVRNDVLVCFKSSLNKPGQLFAIKIHSVNGVYDFCDISCHEISPSRSIPDSDQFIVEHGYTLYNKPTTIFYGPKTSKCPLIVWPHGGPHYVSSDTYLADAAFFVRIGFAVLFINYRGSVGLGKDYAECLHGKIGIFDVDDVYSAVQSNPSWSNRKLLLYGGSHGGFLASYLSGQYPNEFNAVSIRNPVLDVLSMFMTSDVPDWAITMAGFNYSEVDNLASSKEVMLKLADISPLKNVSKIRAPTLLLLGEKDLRVPPSQGLAYYHLLKKHGVTTKLFMYNDCHPLSAVATEMDSTINTALWFIKYSTDDSEL